MNPPDGGTVVVDRRAANDPPTATRSGMAPIVSANDAREFPTGFVAPSAQPVISPDNVFLIVEKPIWNRRSLVLTWADELVLKLTDHASVEGPILDEFQRLGWIWAIRDPTERDSLGDPTLPRRHALVRLNQHQGERPRIVFASSHGGLICWFPSAWTQIH